MNGYKIVSEIVLKLANDPNANKQSWQAEFPKVTECCKCKSPARLALTIKENPKEKEYISNLYPNLISKGGDAWLHDACAIAIYFCTKCLEPTALYNQA
jgi:hypothetical protein